MPRKKYKVEYLPIAERDLAEILAYIAIELAAPQAAANLLEKIERAVKSLDTFPYAYSVYRSPELRTAPFEFRALVVSSYLVFYYITENTVTIARIAYSGRDMRNVLT